MSKYNYTLAKHTIQKYSDLLESASLGMAEDWYYTAETIYQNGVFEVELENEPKVAGISGSTWATPTLQLSFKDGTEKFLDCYEGDTDVANKPDWLELGCLSSPAQESIDIRRGKYLGSTGE